MNKTLLIIAATLLVLQVLGTISPAIVTFNRHGAALEKGGVMMEERYVQASFFTLYLSLIIFDGIIATLLILGIILKNKSENQFTKENEFKPTEFSIKGKIK